MSDLLKEMVSLSKTAGVYEAPKVWAHLDPYNLILWTSFAGYGRADQIQSNLQIWNKTLGAMNQELADLLSGIGLSITRDDVFFDPDLRSPRDRNMNAYTRIKPGAGKWGTQELEQVQEIIATQRRINGLKEMF
jgi:hypothetical protein